MSSYKRVPTHHGERVRVALSRCQSSIHFCLSGNEGCRFHALVPNPHWWIIAVQLYDLHNGFRVNTQVDIFVRPQSPDLSSLCMRLAAMHGHPSPVPGPTSQNPPPNLISSVMHMRRGRHSGHREEKLPLMCLHVCAGPRSAAVPDVFLQVPVPS